MAVAAFIATALHPFRTHAFNPFELEAYPAVTIAKHAQRIENLTTFVASGQSGGGDAEVDGAATDHLLRTTLGYDYGVADWAELGARLDVIRPDGSNAEFAGARLRARGTVWKPHTHFVDLGWYVEAEAPHNQPTDFELASRIILSRQLGPLSLRLNPIFEFPIVSEEERTLELSYAAGASWRINRHIRLGLEAFGGFGRVRSIDGAEEQQHYLFPVLGLHLRRWVISIGPGFGLTRASDDVVLKLLIEYELPAPRHQAAM